jgi:hypothetical protein
MIGKFSNRALLTGAGWSRNWGGFLAGEVWSWLIGNARVRRNQAVRELLLEESAFEAALGRTSAPPFSDADREDLQSAILDTFVSMDRAIAQPSGPSINFYQVQELLFRFWGRPGEGNSAGYLFTLNQDLFFERYLFNELVTGAPRGALPGLVSAPGQRWFQSDIGPYSSAFVMQPLSDPQRQGQLQNQMNVIKLHGSFNWRSAENQRVIVVGTDKTAKIAANPLLAWYADIFKEVLCAGDVRLMVIGYGFADEHINAVIASAIENHGLQVLIWNTTSDLRQLILQAPHGAAIWRGLITMATRPLIEVFPSDQSETEEYRRIRETFFA